MELNGVTSTNQDQHHLLKMKWSEYMSILFSKKLPNIYDKTNKIKKKTVAQSRQTSNKKEQNREKKMFEG